MRQDDKTTTRTMTMEEHNAILRDQLSGMVERLAAMEKKLDLEVANRDSLVAAEVERLMPSIKTRIREEVKGELGDVDAMRKELEMREARLRQDMELMAERLVAQVRQKYAEEKEKVLSSGIFQMQDVQKITLEAFTAAVEGDAARGEACVEKMREKAPEAVRVMEEELREALDKAEKKGVRQAQHMAELVRMLFTRKSERVELDGKGRETLLESVLKSVELTDAEKEDRRQCHRRIEEYRKRMSMAKTLEGDGKKGHGRKPIPDSIPRLAPKTLYPDGYEGHEDEYRIIGKDVQEFILPVSVCYVVQPIERPVVVRKGDVLAKPEQSPCFPLHARERQREGEGGDRGKSVRMDRGCADVRRLRGVRLGGQGRARAVPLRCPHEARIRACDERESDVGDARHSADTGHLRGGEYREDARA